MVDLTRNLYQNQIDDLVKVIAEVAECQYRQGWIDGRQAIDEDAEIEPQDLMQLPLNWSPYPLTGRGGMLSVDRLARQHQQRLKSVGIYIKPFKWDYQILDSAEQE